MIRLLKDKSEEKTLSMTQGRSSHNWIQG